EVVLVLPKDAADLLYDPYYHEFVVPDANTLPDGVHAEKQLLHQRVADQADVSAVLGFRDGEVTAKLHGARVNIRHARRLAVEVRALHDGHNRDERGHTHSQAQHRERGAQLVCAQGAEALHKIVTHGKHRLGENSHSLYQIPRSCTASSRVTRELSLSEYEGKGAS